MRLEGSCHCGAVRFSVDTRHPQPYQRCYCSICRKTGGAGGYMINLAADAKTLAVEGTEHTREYRATPAHARVFCTLCGTHLYAYNDRWPDHLHPVASAVDSELPVPAAHVHMMVGSKASWVEVEVGPDDATFDEYPQDAISAWHDARGLTVE